MTKTQVNECQMPQYPSLIGNWDRYFKEGGGVLISRMMTMMDQ